MIKPFPADYDPYGKDAGRSTTGKEMVFRLTKGDDGRVGRVSVVPPEEVELTKLPRKSKAKRIQKGMGR